jgi:hypothetical protein
MSIEPKKTPKFVRIEPRMIQVDTDERNLFTLVVDP